MTAPPPRRVLVIEDDPDIAALLALHVSQLPAQVRCEANGLEGLRIARQEGPWDAIILDLQLPAMSGLDVCKQLRQTGHDMPILMLTARTTELDRVLGLELGADDYLTKPFGVMELQARVRALWRRAAVLQRVQGDVQPQEPQELQAGALRIDRVRRKAWLRGQEMVLTPREFDLLWHFAKQPGRALSRSDLLAQVWGYSHDGYDHTVNSHINRLRNKLGEGYIHTVWGMGYRFEVTS